jgi:hypothetical protein
MLWAFGREMWACGSTFRGQLRELGGSRMISIKEHKGTSSKKYVDPFEVCEYSMLFHGHPESPGLLGSIPALSPNQEKQASSDSGCASILGRNCATSFTTLVESMA